MSKQNNTNTSGENVDQSCLPNFNAKGSAYSVGLGIMVCMSAIAFLQTGQIEPTYLTGSVIMLSLTGAEMFADWKDNKERKRESRDQ